MWPALWVYIAMQLHILFCGSMQLCGYTVIQPALWVYAAMQPMRLCGYTDTHSPLCKAVVTWLCSYIVVWPVLWVYMVM